MTRAGIIPALTALALGLSAGCVSQEDLYRGVSDDLHFTGKVLGFALDADIEALATRLALLKAFQDDPKLPLLEAQLGTIAEVEAKLKRIQAERRGLLEEHQRLKARYTIGGEG